jgi:hypothetical protein
VKIMGVEVSSHAAETSPATIPVPAPTAWPIVLAFGMFLLFAGLATSAAVSVLGAVAAVAGLIGWCRDVLPRSAHVSVTCEPAPLPVATDRPKVAQFQLGREAGRAWLPVETYPVSAGVKGGLAGGLVMAALAVVYGALSGHGIWYPVNLLAAGLFPAAVTATTAELGHFYAGPFLVACVIHLMASLLVGLLYGAMLPMLPRRPILLAGIVAPVLWSGLLHSAVAIINPVFNQRVDWSWFVLSQVGFGIVAGIVVSRQQRVRTWQGAPFAIRAGIEGSGLERDPAGERRDR